MTEPRGKSGVTLVPGTRQVIVFGGSFDPPHRAHVELPRLVREAIGADVVLYVPAKRSPFKGSAPGASGDERMEMLRLAVGDDARSLVSAMELERGEGPSYTVETLRELAREFGPGVRLRLLMGADQAAEFHRWREPAEIMRLAEPVVMLRAPAESWEGLRGRLEPHWTPGEVEQWGRRVVRVPTMDVSATAVRELLASGADNGRLDRWMMPQVLRYVRERGLYRRE